MKKTLLAAMLLMSSISHAILLEDGDILGRMMIVDQNEGRITGVIQVTNDASKTRLGNLQVEMSLTVNGSDVKANCSGLMDVNGQELQVVQCKDSNVKARLEFAKSEALLFLTGHLASAKFTMISSVTELNLKDVAVDIKNLNKK